jgi:signal transduction histidine kinase
VRVALESGATITALIAAFLVYGRLVSSGSRGDLILCAGLVVVGLSGGARAFAPSFNGSNNVVVWAPLITSTLVAGGAVAAAHAPAVRLRHPNRRLLYLAGLILAAGAAVGVASALGQRIPTGISPDLSPAAAKPPRVVGSTALLSVQLVAAALFAAAAVGFANSAQRTGDEWMAWLALGAGLGSVTLLNYFLFPPVYPNWIFTGDIPRAVAFVAILIGALRQIAAYQQTALRAAVVEERQRIARDLHDGLAQDLAYLSIQAGRLSRDQELGEIARTAKEALAQSRAVIANMRLSDAPLGQRSPASPGRSPPATASGSTSTSTRRSTRAPASATTSCGC